MSRFQYGAGARHFQCNDPRSDRTRAGRASATRRRQEPREALVEAKDTIFEPLFVAPIAPPPLTRQCCLPSELEHPHERFERHSELADALPSIFIAFGIAYALGVLTGGMIFSSPSMIEAL